MENLSESSAKIRQPPSPPPLLCHRIANKTTVLLRICMITSSTGFGFTLLCFIVMFDRLRGWLSGDPVPPSPSFGPADESDGSNSQEQGPISKKTRQRNSRRLRLARPQITAEQQAEIVRVCPEHALHRYLTTQFRIGNENVRSENRRSAI